MHSSDRAPHKGPMRTFAQTLLILVLVASVASLMAWAHSRVTRSSDDTAAQQATVGRAGESRADEITPEPSPDWIRSNSAVWDAKGTLVSEDPLTDLQPDLAAYMGQGKRAAYRSVSGLTGAATEVSGTFFIPKGTPPSGGWPVASFAHGTTGLTTECAPSAAPDLRGYVGVIFWLLSAGYAVAFTDYEGLGGPGLHPLLEPKTAAFNVIDAVRALRALYPDISTRWVAVGNSQGGQAAWAANELNSFYGGGLDLVGSVALAPAADLSGLADLAYQQTLTPEQLTLMPLIIVGTQRSAPTVAVDHLLHGSAAAAQDILIGCGEAAQRFGTVLPADVKPTDSSDRDAFAKSLRSLALPKAKLSAPMLVMSGTRDPKVFPEWISAAVDRSCRLGGQIALIEVPGAGHDLAPDERVRVWMSNRFIDAPAPTTCGAR